MATPNEIEQVLIVLAGARLRNAPNQEEAAQVMATWKRVMGDIPGSLMLQAADEYILSGEFWPTPAQFRRLAQEIFNRPTRATAGQFADPSHPRIESRGATYHCGEPVDVHEPEDPAAHRGMYQVSADGWHAIPRGVTAAAAPARELSEYEQAVAALEAKYYDGGLPTDEELAQIDALSEPASHEIHEPASLFGLPVVVRNV